VLTLLEYVVCLGFNEKSPNNIRTGFFLSHGWWGPSRLTLTPYSLYSSASEVFYRSRFRDGMWGEGTVMTVRLFLEEVVSDEGGVVVETLAGGAGKGGANIVSKKEGNGKADGVLEFFVIEFLFVIYSC
jgi:hypothetical protein